MANLQSRYSQSAVVQGLLQLPYVFDKYLSSLGKWPLFGVILLSLVFSAPLITTPLMVKQQAAVAAFLLVGGWWLVRLEGKHPHKNVSEALHLFMAWLSIITTLRYLYYRTHYTLNLDSWVNGTFSLLLYGAELYAIGILLLSYFQTLRIRDRTPVDLTTIPQQHWFNVDVYIPTYNEDVAIVRKTALAAMAIDYPQPKKNVYILDDGRKYPERRQQLQALCDELGCTLLTRPNNDHAKAGNINTALKRTPGDLILILDCDHIPAKSILQRTVGFFFDRKVALVQTPHWFYNPDPFERNLLTDGRVPVANELFYKILQKGNDFWNAAFFCGSAAIVRKQALLEVGGIAIETVTEDCHTSLRLHSRGYDSIYYDKIMVAGLAPETFSSYIGQQVRWARGMAQILRLENPLLNPRLRLSIPQRICYFSATSHFFFGFPRLLYAFAPMLYLLFGINLIRGLGIETMVYALPHIALAMYANYVTYKTVRFSFWNEVFESALAFQTGIVTLMAIINPKLGKFNVTEKGLSVTERSFDWRSAQTTIVMVALLLISLLTVPFWIGLRPDVTETVLVNAFWCIFNLVLMVAALMVAYEQPQSRRTHRLQRQLKTTIYHQNQSQEVIGRTQNISETGAQILFDSWPNLPDQITLEFKGDSNTRVFVDAKILRLAMTKQDKVSVTVEFVEVTRQQWDDLVLVLYSDVDEWYAQTRENRDNPLESLQFVLTALLRAFRETKAAQGTRVRKQVNTEAELYWEGQYYPATVTEMGVSSLRLEMAANVLPNSEFIKQLQPPVGLLMKRHQQDLAPIKLLAQVKAIETEASDHATPWISDRVSVELSLPESLNKSQRKKINTLLTQL